MSQIFSLLYSTLAEIMDVLLLASLKEFFPEMDPSSECNWGFNSSKTAAHLILAIYVPFSYKNQQLLNSIPSIIFSYAVTMVERISNGLTGVLNQDTLLAYLSHCSRSIGVNPIKFVNGEDKMVQMVEDDLSTKIDNSQITCPIRLDLIHKSDDDFEVHDKADDYIKFVLANIVEIWAIWPLVKFGCINEVLTTLRLINIL